MKGVGIEPEIRAGIGHAGIANLVCTELVQVGKNQRSIRDIGREGQAGFERADSTEVPTPEDQVNCTTRRAAEVAPASEGQFPHVADGQRLSAIVVGWTVILPPSQIVGEGSAGLAVHHGLSVGVGDEEIQTVAGALLHLNLHCVIAGVIAVASFVKALRESKFLEIEPTSIEVVASTVGGAVGIERSLIYVGIDEEMPSHISDVSDFRGKGLSDLPLNGQIP